MMFRCLQIHIHLYTRKHIYIYIYIYNNVHTQKIDIDGTLVASWLKISANLASFRVCGGGIQNTNCRLCVRDWEFANIFQRPLTRCSRGGKKQALRAGLRMCVRELKDSITDLQSLGIVHFWCFGMPSLVCGREKGGRGRRVEGWRVRIYV